MTTAITYRTGDCASKLRTVLVDEVRTSVVLLPDGGMDIMSGKLLHGTTCRHEFWDKALGTSGDDFNVPVAQVHQVREMRVSVKVRTHK